MRYRLLVLAVAFLVIATLACGGGGDEDTPIPPTRTPSPTQPPPPPTQPPPPPTQPSGDEMVTLTVFNDSSETVCFIYISPSTSDTWGEDWLGDDVIVPGDTYTFDVPAGTYDLEADDCDGNALDTQVEVDLSEPLEWTFTDAGEGAGLDFTLESTFGEVELSPGFTPDPFTVDLFSGGIVDVEALNLGVDCTGYAASAPDFNLYLSDDSGDLRIFFVADGGEDATLIINDPYADWVCNDDAPGDTLDPMIEFEDASSGWYAIWVGSYSSDEAIVGTLYITEMDYHPESFPDEGTTGESGELDFMLEPTFGEVELSPGFTPDPFTVDLFSGGIVDVEALNLGVDCTGYAASAPDFNLYLSDDSGDLRIFFVADGGEDATLIINDPYADWICSDDAPGDTFDPMIEFEDASSGWYAIWVGSYSSDEAIVGTLYITEMDYDPSNLP